MTYKTSVIGQLGTGQLLAQKKCVTNILNVIFKLLALRFLCLFPYDLLLSLSETTMTGFPMSCPFICSNIRRLRESSCFKSYSSNFVLLRLCTFSSESKYEGSLSDRLFHMSHLMGKPTMWFPNRSDTNQPAQAQKRARSVKFRI